MMPEALTDAQWTAIREIHEGEPPTQPRLAAAAGIHYKSISRRASIDKWKTLDWRFPRVRAAHRAMIAIAESIRAGEELDPAEPFEGEGAEDEAFAPEALEPLPELPPAQRAARLKEMLTRRTEEMLRAAEAGRPLEGRQVTALANLVQLAERIAALAAEDARAHTAEEEEKVADILHRIAERIRYLAREFAREILTEHGLSEAEVDAAMARWEG